jgi:hypothetical protein
MEFLKSRFICVYEASGKLDAEMICAFLASFGIDAHFYEESVGVTYGFTVSPLGKAKIMVPEEQMEEVHQILQDMEAGKFQLPETDLLEEISEQKDASNTPE